MGNTFDNTVDDAIAEKLQSWFGYESFRTGQKETIATILANKNAVAVLPTGTGKSLIYQFCGYWRGGITLIVSPLLSLMDNQVMQMKVKGEKRVAALNSMLSREERQYVLAHLAEYRFLFVSPEQLQSERLLQGLKNNGIGLFVVDEAHCISQWGLDFRPDYLSLGRIREQLGNPLTLALTATASERVLQDIMRYLHLAEVGTQVHRFDPNRPNIFYDIRPVEFREKEGVLLDLLQRYPLPGIIYFTSKAVAEDVNRLIAAHTPLRSDTYHADRSNEDRNAIQHQFLAGELDVICATSAFGMGINKLDIRFVIHYHVPGSLEEYLQEAGRAGRDGQQSVATLFYDHADIRFRLAKIRETDITPLLLREWLQGKISLPESLSDSDSALLQVARRQSLTEQAAMGLVQKRQGERVEQLRKVSVFAEATTCKRELLSRTFNHILVNKPEWCCSSCQTDISPLLEHMEGTAPAATQPVRSETNWEEKIKFLFRLQNDNL